MPIENNVAAQAGDEPMREAFFAWFAEHGSGHQYKESQDAFCAGYCAAQVSPRATADVERDAARYRWLLNNYARGDGYTDIDAALNEGEPEKYLSPAIDAAILATTKPGA